MKGILHVPPSVLLSPGPMPIQHIHVPFRAGTYQRHGRHHNPAFAPELKQGFSRRFKDLLWMQIGFTISPKCGRAPHRKALSPTRVERDDPDQILHRALTHRSTTQ
ncbi:hypothetical protein IE53DRAFT_383852 [Violaceomyces palustris]|uniref:Uncharacterized protein n=1 Tax=Violaceomyces palustris TaxID=1673888 RepID=A0ACD0P6G1_9BASI|nr:hypothetical protein IE53DRAFT_383852 [Violaceomyces palustris]